MNTSKITGLVWDAKKEEFVPAKKKRKSRKATRQGHTKRIEQRVKAVEELFTKEHGSFTCRDISEVLAEILKDQKAPAASVSHIMTELEKKGKVRVVGLTTPERGKPAKIYKGVNPQEAKLH